MLPLVLFAGWLLMYPRFGNDGKPLTPPGPPETLGDGVSFRMLMDIPPVSETHWAQVSAHDSAKECEQAHATLLQQKTVQQDDGETPAPHLIRAARCVPAEYIYPQDGPRKSQTGLPIQCAGLSDQLALALCQEHPEWFKTNVGAPSLEERWHKALDDLGVPR